jgi:hypothetical protein
VRIPAFILAICLLALAGVCPAHANAQEVEDDTPTRFSLRTFIGDMDNLAKRIEASDAASAHEIVGDLPTIWRVRHGGEEYQVATDWVVASLSQARTHPADWTKTRQMLIERIRLMRDEASMLQEDNEDREDATQVKPVDARAALREVLAASEFKQRDEARWNDEIRRRINRWIVDMLDRLPITRGATAAVSKVFAWIVAIGALIALVVYLWRARLPRRSITPLALDLPRPTSAEWAARAYAALRAGDAREAMHCGYHAVLFRLEEQGVWHVDDARTPREYVHLLPAQDARRAAFVDLTRRFEQTWYGSRDADGPGLIKNLEAFGCSAPSPSNPAI